MPLLHGRRRKRKSKYRSTRCNSCYLIMQENHCGDCNRRIDCLTYNICLYYSSYNCPECKFHLLGSAGAKKITG